MIYSSIFRLILKDLSETYLYMPIAVILGLMVILLLVIVKKCCYYFKRRTFMSAYQVTAAGTFVFYIYIVLMLSYFSRAVGSRNEVSLIFLETWKNSAQSRAYVFENIMMMIPFGFLLPVFFKPARNFFCCIPLGFMFSVCLEYAQYLSKRGYLQTDDVVMNVLGTLIGFWAFVLLKITVSTLNNNKFY